MSTQPGGPRRTITAPVIEHHGPGLLKFILVGFASTIINGVVLALLFVMSLLMGIKFDNDARGNEEPPVRETTEVEQPQKEYDLTNTDLGLDDTVPLNYNVDRIEEVSVPGPVDPTQAVGIVNAPEAAPTNIPPPPGSGGGTGGAPIDPNISGTGSMAGTLGGMGGIYSPGGFGGRSGSTRIKMLQEGGGNARSEKAVADGLRWLALHQASDGHWSLNGFNRHARTEPLGHPKGRVVGDNSTPGTSRNNDTAGTAFGLLPFLAAGITHKQASWKGWLKEEVEISGTKYGPGTPVEIRGQVNETTYRCRIKKDKGYADVELTEKQVFSQPDYSKGVGAGLRWLVAKQSKSGSDRGYYGGDQYSHGLATIAMCEAYGLTSDPTLKASAQMALDYIALSQDPAGGGWRYARRQAGDTSVTGWMVMALKSGQMAGLSVPRVTLKKVESFLNSCETSDRGASSVDKGCYSYVPGGGATPAMTAVGALCRQYLGVNPRNPSLLASVKYIKKHPPRGNHVYYEYYATQVMHHMGGEAWDFWNKGPDGKSGIRDTLIAKQDQKGANKGSFPGNEHVGGRLGSTSLCLLSLEVYYRHLPLYRREVGAMKPEND